MNLDIMKLKVDNSFYNINFVNKKVMIIVPHQDDELFLCGTILGAIRNVTSDIYIVFSTNGDYKQLFWRRYCESIYAISTYKIPSQNIIYMGYGNEYDSEYGHIYHAPRDMVVCSKKGRKKTYGRDFCYKRHHFHNEFTLNNIMCDLKEIISTISPQVIFCNDLDWHPDHRANSLIFDKVMGNILRETPGYHPEIYKGFIYFLGWDGKQDYTFYNLHSTKKPSRTLSSDKRFEFGNPYFSWNERIRFPIDIKLMQRKKNKLYKAISRYRFSQNAKKYFGSMMNGDAVYWKRCSHNLSLEAELRVSSGEAELLRDFVIVDSSNIVKYQNMPYDRGVWYPEDDDTNICIEYNFKKEILAEKIVFYRDIESYGKTEIEGSIYIIGSDKQIQTFRILSNEIKKEVSIGIGKIHWISKIIICLKQAKVKFGFTEIEIVYKENSPLVVKSEINDDFIYHYYIDKDCKEVDIKSYKFPLDLNISNTILDSHGEKPCWRGETLLLGENFRKCQVKTSSLSNDKIYDIITIEREDNDKRKFGMDMYRSD